MVSEHFWQQNRLILSLELFGCILALSLAALLFISVRRRLQARDMHSNESPKQRLSPRIFIVCRWSLGIIGIATLIATVVPGLMPFSSRIDPNLELSGIILFFLWPIIVIQIVLGFLPTASKTLNKESTLAWILLIAGYIIFLNIDKTAIGLMYD